MAKALAQFTIKRTGEDFLLILEDEDGETTEFTADADMLDEVTDAIDEALELEDEAELEDDEDEETEAEE